MDEHNNDEVQSDHQDGDQNQSDDGQNHSEQNQNESESESEQQSNDSDDSPNGAEQNLNASEQERSDHSEHYRTAPNCSEQHADFTITVREAARIFENAGVPRTERAITKWCNQNARGITRLDCCYNEPERKYYITTQSIDRVIREERHKFQYTEYRSGSILSAAAEDLSEQIRTERQNSAEDEQKASEQGRNEAEHIPHEAEQVRNEPKKRSEPVREREDYDESEPEITSAGSDDETIAKRVKDLKMENYDLKVQLEGQKFLVRKFDELVAGERERHEKEKLALIDRLTDARHEIGALEQKLLQLEAPQGDKRGEPIDVETSENAEEKAEGADENGDSDRPHHNEQGGG